MRVRRIQLDSDYPIIKTWWEVRGSEAPQRELLSSVGIMVEQDDLPVACAFLYQVKESPLGIIEWEATNPAITSPILKVRALGFVFDFFEVYSRDHGIAILLSWVAQDRGDGRLLARRNWVRCPGQRHELMAFKTEVPCPPP